MPCYPYSKGQYKNMQGTVHSNPRCGSTYMSIDRGVDKGGVVHAYSGILLSHEKGLIMSLAATRTDLERVVLVKAREER